MGLVGSVQLSTTTNKKWGLKVIFYTLQIVMKDYYKILEIETHVNDDEIKKAYKRLALKYHPDKNQTFGSEEKFKEIGEAYEVLSDPTRRQEYDRAARKEQISEILETITNIKLTLQKMADKNIDMADKINQHNQHLKECEMMMKKIETYNN